MYIADKNEICWKVLPRKPFFTNALISHIRRYVPDDGPDVLLCIHDSYIKTLYTTTYRSKQDINFLEKH